MINPSQCKYKIIIVALHFCVTVVTNAEVINPTSQSKYKIIIVPLDFCVTVVTNAEAINPTSQSKYKIIIVHVALHFVLL